MKALGINIYGGGFTLGVQKHFDVIAQWEEITLGKRTFELNFTIPRLPDINQWPDMATKVDFVFANPPCVPWSNASVWMGRRKADMFLDKRLDLTRHTMEAALTIEPAIFISESVENAYNIGATHYDDYAKEWMRRGYSVTYFLNDAIIQGAPCVRRRFHFIASKYRLALADKPGPFKVRSISDVIGDLLEVKGQLPQHVENKYCMNWVRDLWDHTPEWQKLIHTVMHLGDAYTGTKPGFLLRKLPWETPGPTMVGFVFFHPKARRWITNREALRICTYPDDFICHNATEAVDAVLPAVAEFLALTAKRTLEQGKPVTRPQKRLVDWRPYGKVYHFRQQLKRGLIEEPIGLIPG